MPSFEGLHDITMTQLPPHRKPYLIMAPEDRIGTTSIPIDSEKIVAILESDYRDQTTENSPADATSKAIANHLIEFLEHEVTHGRLPKNLLPIQSGIGNIANAVIGGLAGSKFENLKVWTEVCPGSKYPGQQSLTWERFCKIHSSISSILAVSTSQQQPPSVSPQKVFSASTTDGGNTMANFFSDPNKSLTLQK